MKQSGAVRAVIVVALVLVLGELFLQARNYSWLTDFFDEEPGTRSGVPPIRIGVIRVVWLVALVPLVALVLLGGGSVHRLVAGSAVVAFAGSLWLTPSQLVLPWQDGESRTFASVPDTEYEVALVLLAVAAVAVAALFVVPRRSA